jgi:hypothetical protein
MSDWRAWTDEQVVRAYAALDEPRRDDQTAPPWARRIYGAVSALGGADHPDMPAGSDFITLDNWRRLHRVARWLASKGGTGR